MVPALTVVWMGRGCCVHTHFFSAVSPPFGCTRRYLASSVVLGLWCCPRAFSGCTVSSLRAPLRGAQALGPRAPVAAVQGLRSSQALEHGHRRCSVINIQPVKMDSCNTGGSVCIKTSSQRLHSLLPHLLHAVCTCLVAQSRLTLKHHRLTEVFRPCPLNSNLHFTHTWCSPHFFP